MTDMLDAEPRLPDQIAREVALAEQIEREIAAAFAPQPVSADAQAEDSPSAPPVAEAEAPSAVPQPEAQSPEAAQDDPNSETWQSRYNALQGKYNAEVPRLHQQLRELTSYMQSLEAKIDQRAEAPSSPEDPLPEDKRKEAIDVFGEDIVDYIHRAAQAEAERRIAELRNSQQAVEQRIAQSENERFFAQVDAAVPGWRDIDTDPAWLGWLQEYDPLLGAPRTAALEQAANVRDVARVAHLFKTFEAHRASARPAPVTPPAPSRAQLEQVTPRPAGNASMGTQNPSRIYTQAEIHQLLDPRYLNRLPRDQQAAIERDIDLAVAEGRIAA